MKPCAYCRLNVDEYSESIIKAVLTNGETRYWHPECTEALPFLETDDD